MTIINIVFDNFVTLCLIAGLGVLIFSNRMFDKRSNRYFMCFIGIVLALDIADMADFYMTSFSTLNNFRYITSAIGYTLRPATLAIIINIFLRRKRFNIGIWIPVIILGIVAFTSYYTHIMFWFSNQNLFLRGPLGYASHFLSAVYAAALVTLTIKSYKSLDFGEILIVAYIVFVCVLATHAESSSPLKFLLPGAMSVSCAMYYLFLYVQVYKRDVLTSLLNRRSLYADVEKMRSQKYIVISMDLNGLKEINDTEGHQAGDKALCTFADTCQDIAKNKYRIYRTGGDEFIALGKGKTLEEAQRFIDTVRAALKKTRYMSSFGYAQYSGNESFDVIFNEADARMYEDKMNYKHRMTLRDIQR